MSRTQKSITFDGKPMSPCYGCEKPKRHEGCHDRCPEFIAFRKKRDADLDAIRERKKIDGLVSFSSIPFSQRKQMSQTQKKAYKTRPERPSKQMI